MGAPSLLGFNMDQTFFGFKSTDRNLLHEKLFELLWVGDGRWSFNDIYHLPLNIRKIWVAKYRKIKDSEQRQLDEYRNKPKSSIARPPNIKKK